MNVAILKLARDCVSGYQGRHYGRIEEGKDNVTKPVDGNPNCIISVQYIHLCKEGTLFKDFIDPVELKSSPVLRVGVSSNSPPQLAPVAFA